MNYDKLKLNYETNKLKLQQDLYYNIFFLIIKYHEKYYHGSQLLFIKKKLVLQEIALLYDVHVATFVLHALQTSYT
jgi:hypothetical protein